MFILTIGIIIILFILLSSIYLIRNDINKVEYEYTKLYKNNISYSIKKCSSFNFKHHISYNEFIRIYPNTKYYQFSTLESFPSSNFAYYCYTNEKCVKQLFNITTSVEPVVLLTHNLYSTSSNILQNCNQYIFKGQCNDLSYYKKYIPLANYSVIHVQYGVFFGGWHTETVYHGLIDSLSRIVLLYNFLLKHKEIYIHISPPRYKQDEIRYILNILGFSNERIINSNFIYADHLYIIFPFYCLAPSTYIINKFNKLLRYKVNQLYKLNYTKSKNILIIERLTNRILTNFNKIVYMLKKSYPDHLINIYRENNTNMKEVFSMFYRADVVIGEFGAGLANIVFCKEGITVFEISLSYFRDDYAKITVAMNSKHYIYYTNASTPFIKYFYVNETDFLCFVKRYY